MRLEDVEAAAQAKLDRARDLISQYEDTITELSQDSSSLTASAQALRDDNSALSASLETARAEAEHLQVPLSDPPHCQVCKASCRDPAEEYYLRMSSTLAASCVMLDLLD